METNAQLTPITQPSDAAMQIAVPLGIEGLDRGMLTIVVPHAALDTVRGMLAGTFAGDRRDRDGEWTRHFRNTFHETPLELSSVLVEATFDLGEVMAWRCGDTIEMPGEVDQPATVICDGVQLFRGRVGSRNNNIAVRIEEDLAEGEERMEDVEADAVA